MSGAARHLLAKRPGAPAALTGSYATVAAYWPGLLLAATVAAAASFVSAHYGAPVMLLALLMGIAFNFLVEDGSRCVAGVEFASKTLLRTGVALLGTRISFADFVVFGWHGMTTIACLVALTVGCGMLAARLFRKTWRFGLLTGGAVAICGASAALAISAVIARDEADETDTLFTVVAVTSLSTIAMVLYPILFGLLDLSDSQIGFLIGATIHDVAQVVGAGFSVSPEAGEAATLAKLFRVALLPVVLTVIILTSGQGTADRKLPTLPWFLVVFLVLAFLNSLVALPDGLTTALETASQALLVTAIASLGVKTSLKTMLSMGGEKIVSVVLVTLCLLAGAVIAMQLWAI